MILLIGIAAVTLKFNVLIGLIIIEIGLLAGLIYAMVTTGLTTKERGIIATMMIFTLAKQIAVMLNLPGAGYFQLLLLIPITLFLYISFGRINLKTEYPFLLMTAVIALLSFF